LTEPSIPQGDNGVTPLVQQWLDLISKGWVPLLAAVYGSGYLIVSIYHASLGLNEINLLRPQVAAAGLLFLAMASGAIFLVRYLRSALERLGLPTTTLHGYFFAVCFGGFYLSCIDCMTTIAIQPILHFEGSQLSQGVFTLMVATGVIGGAAILASGESARIRRWVTHWVALLFCGIATLTLLAMSLPYHHQFGLRQFAAYLFTMQIISVSITRPLEIPAGGSTHNWLNTAAQLLVPLLAYSIGIYPHVRRPFGGGDPTSGQIFLTTTIGNDPAKQFTAAIIDETDAGFYVIQSNQKNVRYVPRTLVSSIEFNNPTNFF
jgi:hypothetical protein